MGDLRVPTAVTTNSYSYEIKAPSLSRQPGSEHAFSASGARRQPAANRYTGRSARTGDDACAELVDNQPRSAPRVAVHSCQLAVRAHGHATGADSHSYSSLSTNVDSRGQLTDIGYTADDFATCGPTDSTAWTKHYSSGSDGTFGNTAGNTIGNAAGRGDRSRFGHGGNRADCDAGKLLFLDRDLPKFPGLHPLGWHRQCPDRSLGVTARTGDYAGPGPVRCADE